MYYVDLGNVPHKRHTQFRSSDGTLRHEEVMGVHGFAGMQSILYHLRPPTEVLEVVDHGSADVEFEEPGPLRHRHLRSGEMHSDGDAISSRRALMGNQDLIMSVSTPTQPMDYFYRFAAGDELIFVHRGHGVLETQFGELKYRPGDYLGLPTGTTWRIAPNDDEQRFLVVEAYGHIEPPKRYLNRRGQFGEHSPYCERDIRRPQFQDPRDEKGEFEVRVKARGRLTGFKYQFHPFDVVGWDGYLWPFAFNIEDFEPITGRVHQPPPVHQTFDGPGFVVCSFVPRLFDYHPEAIPAPYNHSNVDSDEVLYYVEGNFMSRRGIDEGSLTVHPNGIPHGPHPGTYEGSIGQSRTDELAVMVDTFRPLKIAKESHSCEDQNYFRSWQREYDD